MEQNSKMKAGMRMNLQPFDNYNFRIEVESNIPGQNSQQCLKIVPGGEKGKYHFEVDQGVNLGSCTG